MVPLMYAPLAEVCSDRPWLKCVPIPLVTVAVVGPNGAGKSTFMNLMDGSILPVAGEVSSGTGAEGCPLSLPLTPTGELPH